MCFNPGKKCNLLFAQRHTKRRPRTSSRLNSPVLFSREHNLLRPLCRFDLKPPQAELVARTPDPFPYSSCKDTCSSSQAWRRDRSPAPPRLPKFRPAHSPASQSRPNAQPRPAPPALARRLCSPSLPLSACALPANRVAAADWWLPRSQSEGGTSR